MRTRYSSSLIPLSKLHFALNDATHWTSHYNGFNYEEFYEFIVDFFEEDQTPEGKAATNELFDWWNRYVSYSRAFLIADTPPDVCFHGLPLPEQPHLDQEGGRHSESYDDNAKHVHLAVAPSFGLHRVVPTRVLIFKSTPMILSFIKPYCVMCEPRNTRISCPRTAAEPLRDA